MADRQSAPHGMTGRRALRHLLGGAIPALALGLAGPALAQMHAQQPQAPSSGTPPQTNWPQVVRPAPDAPNVLVILTDDVGFGASSTFGGPVPTPTFDSLASDGVRYTNMTTTGICSPTRAALLTGRNHNAVNMGPVTNGATGFRGYTSDIPKSAATGARLLKDAGYSTAMFGKGHITPPWETGPSGPFDRWPTGLGFEYFYGFLDGDTNMWAPAIYENTLPVEPPTDDPDYFFEHDMANKAIGWIRTQKGVNPKRPFFVYYAPGTAHAPHHAPKDWIAKFRGKFDQGWDAVREETLARQKALGIVPRGTRLAARPDAIPAWNTLTDQQKRVYARQMEVYAAALSHVDHQIGRVVEEARRQAGGNLMVVYIQGDNGGSVEAGLNGTLNEHSLFFGQGFDLDTIEKHLDELGGPTVMNHYSSGWASAVNAPFPLFKQVPSHFGAMRNGVVVNWPGHAQGGGIRSQYHHVIDVMPTILEAAKITLPETVDGVKQQPFDGVSMRYSFTDPKAKSARTTQYFNIWDNMGIYHDGWMASSMPSVMPWDFGPAMARPTVIEGRQWQLFNVAKDFSQSTDLAAKHPARLEEMKKLFFSEAEKNHALPIHRIEGAAGRPSLNAGVTSFSFSGPVQRIPEDAAPPIVGRSFKLSADIETGENAANGTLLAIGGRFGGMSLYLKDGRPTFVYNYAMQRRTTVASSQPLGPGKHRIELSYNREMGWITPATATLSVNGAQVATGRIDQTNMFRFSLDETFDIGSDTGTPVSPDYSTPNAFAGTIRNVEINLTK
jgi:arylsulfatase A-like enzyme